MNGTPRVIPNGIQDLSILPEVIPETQYGQHLTKAFIMAGKGKYGRTILNGSEAISNYGAETFSKTSKFFNHSTLFAKKAMETSTVILERIDMGGSSANVTQYLDIASELKTIKKRTAAGAISPLADDLVVDVECYRVRLVTKSDNNPISQTGTMTDKDGNPSTMYPLFTFNTLDGAAYNDLGYSITPTENLELSDLENVGQYLYDFTNKRNTDGFVSIVKTIIGSKSAKFGLVDSIDKTTEISVGLKPMYDGSYSNVTDRTLPWIYADATIVVHEDSIRAASKVLAANEAAFVNANTLVDTEGNDVENEDWYDVTGDAATFEAKSMFLNLITFESTKGVPYQTIRLDDTSDTTAGFVVGNSDTTFMLAGGTDFDATLDTAQKRDDYFNVQVRGILQGYLDPNSELMEIALNPESTLYDSGYPIDTKKELTNIISLRHDTCVTLSTYICNVAGDNVMTEADEIAIGTLLKGRLLLNPESAYFSTKVARGIICGGSCVAADSDYQGRIPTTYSLLSKLCLYMGAGSRQWNELFAFDSGDASAATEIKDILPKFVPPAVKGKLWATGINWLEPLYNEKVYQWPAFATVADDNSVLNSIFTIYAAMWIEKEQVIAWKVFTGESRLSAQAFKAKVEAWMKDRLRDVFGTRFLLAPTLTFTEEDLAKGYQWHLNTKIGVNDMYTVVVTSTSVVRKDNF